ncbi:hypothetical protein VZO05_00325 [Aggregatilineales bacterium SYSU G02658]
MSSSVYWLNDKKTVIVASLEGDVTYTEVKNHFDMVAALLDTVEHAVYVCHQLENIRRTSQIQIRDITRTVGHRVVSHPRRVFSYFITSSPRVKMVVDLGCKLFPTTLRRFAFVRTLDEALADIQCREAAQQIKGETISS